MVDTLANPINICSELQLLDVEPGLDSSHILKCELISNMRSKYAQRYRDPDYTQRWTNIRVDKDTRQRLGRLGTSNDSLLDVLKMLLDKVEGKKNEKGATGSARLPAAAAPVKATQADTTQEMLSSQ